MLAELRKHVKATCIDVGPLSKNILNPRLNFSLECTMVAKVIAELTGKFLPGLKTFSENWPMVHVLCANANNPVYVFQRCLRFKTMVIQNDISDLSLFMFCTQSLYICRFVLTNPCGISNCMVDSLCFSFKTVFLNSKEIYPRFLLTNISLNLSAW